MFCTKRYALTSHMLPHSPVRVFCVYVCLCTRVYSTDLTAAVLLEKKSHFRGKKSVLLKYRTNFLPAYKRSFIIVIRRTIHLTVP